MLDQVTSDETLTEEQQQAAMAGVLQQTGLAPQRFNQIAMAAENDPALQQRIGAAIAQHVETARQQQQAQPEQPAEAAPGR